MNVGIIGFGLIGQQRAKSLVEIGGHRLVAIAETDTARHAAIAQKYNCAVEPGYTGVVIREDIDVVIVAVPHFQAAEIVLAALESGKHVLCEKPLGLNAHQSSVLIEEAKVRNLFLGAGFNYRFYPGIQQARKLIESGEIGQLTHARAVLGHSARPGYEQEWKTKKALCGGGVLLDPGIHIIDLIRFFGGEIVSATAQLFNTFWKLDVEDNAFVLLATERQCRAQMHVSITEWKNTFSFDLFGTDGMITIRGRGGFYGPQSLRLVSRWGWLHSPSREEVYMEFPDAEDSFTAELRAFLAITQGEPPGITALGEDGHIALEIMERLYADDSAAPHLACLAKESTSIFLSDRR